MFHFLLHLQKSNLAPPPINGFHYRCTIASFLQARAPFWVGGRREREELGNVCALEQNGRVHSSSTSTCAHAKRPTCTHSGAGGVAEAHTQTDHYARMHVQTAQASAQMHKRGCQHPHDATSTHMTPLARVRRVRAHVHSPAIPSTRWPTSHRSVTGHRLETPALGNRF